MLVGDGLDCKATRDKVLARMTAHEPGLAFSSEFFAPIKCKQKLHAKTPDTLLCLNVVTVHKVLVAQVEPAVSDCGVRPNLAA